MSTIQNLPDHLMLSNCHCLLSFQQKKRQAFSTDSLTDSETDLRFAIIINLCCFFLVFIGIFFIKYLITYLHNIGLSTSPPPQVRLHVKLMTLWKFQPTRFRRTNQWPLYSSLKYHSLFSLRSGRARLPYPHIGRDYDHYRQEAVTEDRPSSFINSKRFQGCKSLREGCYSIVKVRKIPG